MPKNTTVIIVNWNGAQYLDRLLRSLEAQGPAEIIVVDNDSKDDSRRILAQHPEVKCVFNQQNVGFGSAANQAIELMSTPYLLLLNVDVEALPGSLEVLETFLDVHSDVAVVAPQLLFPDGTLQLSCRTFPTIPKLWFYLSYFDSIIPTGYRLKKDLHNQTMEVDQPMGAALMIRKNALDQVGLFDPQFFLYMEEVDLCERIRRKGWKIFYCHDAKMIHVAGGSSAQDWERSQRNYLRSVVLYFKKRVSTSKLILLRCSIAFALLVRSFVLLVCGKFRKAAFYLKMSPAMLYL